MASFFADCPPADPIAPAPEPPSITTMNVGTLQVDADINSTDLEYVCNSTTGVYDLITTEIVAGVAQAPTVTATAIPCGTAAPSFSELRFECACDQAADGSLTATFWRAYTIEIDDTGTPQTAEVGDGWTDTRFTAPYTIVGTEVECSTVGDAVYGVEAHKENLGAGDSWGAPALTQTIGVAVVGNGATVTDSDGTVTPLTNGRGYSWYAVDGSHIIKTPFVIDAGSADVEITYTVLTSA